MSDTSPSSSDGEVEGMPFSMHDLNIGDLIFEDSSFARGAFGRMVKADYFGVTVCVKILKKQRKKELAKFVHREMAALKTLSHPNLIQFIGLTERGNEICLVTEYISGGTLRKLLKDRSITIPWPIRVQIAVDISSAMTYLHSRKIMHRDLKSKNLLVGDNWKIKICDFGFARSVHDKKKAAALTFCGTEEYMAPEVIFGMEYDERAEVYSYGLLLCEIMTRQKVEETVPRTSTTNYGLDHQEFTAHVPRDCPIELLQLAFLCTEFEPKNRPEFREITQLLREIKQNVNTTPVVFGQYMANQQTNTPQPPPQQHHQQAPVALPAQIQSPVLPAHASVPVAPAVVPTHARTVPAQTAAPAAPHEQIPAAVPARTVAPPERAPPPVSPAPTTPPLPSQQYHNMPPPIVLSSDDVIVNDAKHQNGNNKPAELPPRRASPPTRQPAPIPFRRSPSAPIPMPIPGKTAPGKPAGNPRDPRQTQSPKMVSQEVPASAKLGRPAPAKTAPQPMKTAPVAKPPPAKPDTVETADTSPSSRPTSHSFPTPVRVVTAPPPSSASSQSTLPSPSPSPSPSSVSPPIRAKHAAVAGTPARTPSGHATTPYKPSASQPPKSGVPVLPKMPSSGPGSVTPSPNGSPRSSMISAKDRPSSPVSKPAPPGRVGRPSLPSDKKP